MHKIILSSILLTISLSGFTQTLSWDSTYRPNNYGQRVANFRSYPNSTNDIIPLGNSNTIEEMKRLKQLGVDGIITDYPNYFSQL